MNLFTELSNLERLARQQHNFDSCHIRKSHSVHNFEVFLTMTATRGGATQSITRSLTWDPSNSATHLTNLMRNLVNIMAHTLSTLLPASAQAPIGGTAGSTPGIYNPSLYWPAPPSMNAPIKGLYTPPRKDWLNDFDGPA